MSEYPKKFKLASQFGDAPGALLMDSFALFRKKIREELDGTEARRLKEFYDHGLTEEDKARRTAFYKREAEKEREEIDRMIDVFQSKMLRRIGLQ